jgi:hypothetical protein
MILHLKLHCYTNGNSWRPANEGSKAMMFHLVGKAAIDQLSSQEEHLKLMANLHNVGIIWDSE